MYGGKRYVRIKEIGVIPHKEEGTDNEGDGEENKHHKKQQNIGFYAAGIAAIPVQQNGEENLYGIKTDRSRQIGGEHSGDVAHTVGKYDGGFWQGGIIALQMSGTSLVSIPIIDAPSTRRIPCSAMAVSFA